MFVTASDRFIMRGVNKTSPTEFYTMNDPTKFGLRLYKQTTKSRYRFTIDFDKQAAEFLHEALTSYLAKFDEKGTYKA